MRINVDDDYCLNECEKCDEDEQRSGLSSDFPSWCLEHETVELARWPQHFDDISLELIFTDLLLC